MATNPYAPPTAVLDAALTGSTDEDALFRAAIQKNVDYYLPKMQRYAKGERTFPSWHWPALFAGFWWALYRKSWAAAIFVVVVSIVCLIAQAVVGVVIGRESGSALIGFAFTLLSWVLPPLFANGFYYRKVCKLIVEAKNAFPDPTAQCAYLLGKGGTSNVALAVVLPIVIIAFLGILAAIALPAYQDYLSRVKIVEAMAAVRPLQTEFEEVVARTGALPDTLHYATVQTAPGGKYLASVRMDPRSRALLLIFSDQAGPGISGKSLALVPTVHDLGVTWTCRNIDARPAVVPMACRQTTGSE